MTLFLKRETVPAEHNCKTLRSEMEKLNFFPKALRKGPSQERVHSWPPTPDHSKTMIK